MQPKVFLQFLLSTHLIFFDVPHLWGWKYGEYERGRECRMQILFNSNSSNSIDSRLLFIDKPRK
jgi:hypothetical protein